MGRAGIRFACDWLVILDAPAFKQYGDRVAGNPLLLTREEYLGRYTQNPGATVEQMRGACALPFDQFSSCAALVLAGWLWSTAVDVYGDDRTAAPDYDGYMPPETNRTWQRWDRQNAMWDRVVEWMKPVPVNRINYGNP